MILLEKLSFFVSMLAIVFTIKGVNFIHTQLIALSMELVPQLQSDSMIYEVNLTANETRSHGPCVSYSDWIQILLLFSSYN